MCNPDFVVKVSSAVPVAPQYRFSNPVDWTVVKGLNWAVTGPNGAGKSVLADILLGRLALRHGVVERSADGLSGEMLPVGYISFRDIYSSGRLPGNVLPAKVELVRRRIVAVGGGTV